LIIRAAALAAFAPCTAMAQNWAEPFTERDFYLTLRVFMPDEEAHRIARAIVEPPDWSKEESSAWRTVGGVSISDDLLALMSVISDDLRAKVDRYRELDPRSKDPAEQTRWEERRAVARRVLEQPPASPPE
jgi:hypothetical protein